MGSFVTSFTNNLANRIHGIIQELGGVWMLFSNVTRDIFKRPSYPSLIVEQIYQIGIRSTWLVLITAAFTGMVMALQFGLGLEKFGGKMYVPKIVSLSIVREIAPVFCSLMLAARVGAGIASEIASMVVTQQIDAIRVLGTSPIKRIVIPRMIACLIALPLLCILGNIVGIGGAMIVGVSELGLDPFFFYNKVIETVTLTDLLTGIGKTVFFAFSISLSACYYGLNVKGGTQGVGLTTTKAVVVASMSILISDFFLTKLFFVLFEMS
ncbi:MAG: ABC transporter permease [Bdellovibrionales bacterium]|jgi:phospholipid/cholesterol/gamma-HCH transport system permease protein|nr:ABC transporter permease [Bdellovibrionales bacterium]